MDGLVSPAGITDVAGCCGDRSTVLEKDGDAMFFMPADFSGVCSDSGAGPAAVSSGFLLGRACSDSAEGTAAELLGTDNDAASADFAMVGGEGELLLAGDGDFFQTSSSLPASPASCAVLSSTPGPPSAFC